MKDISRTLHTNATLNWTYFEYLSKINFNINNYNFFSKGKTLEIISKNTKYDNFRDGGTVPIKYKNGFSLDLLKNIPFNASLDIGPVLHHIQPLKDPRFIWPSNAKITIGIIITDPFYIPKSHREPIVRMHSEPIDCKPLRPLIRVK